ncbi:Asp-tRNA(Asn)/Glu-tRNA(Gln) amidotransferase subunit GatA [Dehalococcoidia bacterium]|nr:Asp-tRNA(Asn)/Glu-tRNA(Gln) amidotransferase subunit GatA [Dehalococcoidia bacterium]
MTSRMHNLTIQEARNLLDRLEISSVELTQAYLDRIQQVEVSISAFVTVTSELALQQAKRADIRIAKGESASLTGIPMQIKDNICTRSIATTCSSKMLETFVPPFDATVVQRLQAQNVVMLGKGNMDEFAMGSSTENSAFFPTHNPWDLSRVPGGSSGGPAAAVAAREAMAALGSDTGGSIRQPASFCGIVGMKPTYGLVSRFGLVAFASSLDQIGPMTQDVTDCALVLNAISGYDTKDSTSLPQSPHNYQHALTGEIRGMRIGVPKEYFTQGIDEQVKQAIIRGLGVMENLGAIVDWEASLPTTPYALAVYYVIAPSECSANLARYDGVKYGFSHQVANDVWAELESTRQHGFGPEVKRRIMLGTYSLSAGYYDAYYLKASRVRTLISKEFEAAFRTYDVLVTPTSPSVAFRIGEKSQDPLEMYLSDVCTVPANIAGIPGISIPCGFANGQPIGMQILGPTLGEDAILQAAYAFEQATPWRTMRPKL